MAEEPRVNVFDADNKLVSLPQSQVPAATSIGGGFQLASPQEVHDYKLQDEHGGALETGKAFLESGARAATFGASTAVERALGVKPEDIEARKEANPIASTAGEVAGLVGSSLVPFGEGAILGKAGAAASEALGLGGASALSRVGSQAVKGAVETAMFQGGNEVDKMFVGDPSQTVGTALADIGLSGLFGAGAGGALGAITPLWEATLGKKVGNVLENLQRRANGEAVDSVIPKVLENEAIQAPLAEAKPLSEIPSFSDSKNLMAEKVSQVAQEEGWNLSQSLQGDMVNSVLKKLPKIDSPEALQVLKSDVLKMGLKDGMQDAGIKVSQAIQQVEDGLLLKTPQEAPILEKEPIKSLGVLDRVKSGAQSVKDKVMNDLPGSAMAMVSMLSGHPGPALGYLMGHLGKILSTEGQSLKIGLMKVLSSSAPIDSEAFKSLVNFASAVTKGESKLNRGVESLFKAGSSVGSQASNMSDNEAKRLDKKIALMAQDPNQLLNVGGKTNYYAPEHAQEISGTAMRSVNYLNSIRPVDKKLGPLDPPMKPSQAEVEKYNRALNIANKPLHILDHMKNGTMVPDDVVTLKMIHPGLYQRMSEKLMNQIVDGKEVPYKLRFGLSMFLAHPMDSTFSPESIVSNQATFMPSQPPQQQSPGPHSYKTLAKLPSQVMTPDQLRQSQRAGSMKS